MIGDDELRLIEDEILENKNWRNANNHNNSGKKQLSGAAEVIYVLIMFFLNLFVAFKSKTSLHFLFFS